MKKKLKKPIIICSILLVAVVTSYALWCTWENWTGARAWEEVHDRLVAENVEIDFDQLIPELPDDRDNFARTPLIASVTDFKQERAETLSGAAESSSEIVYENPELRDRFNEMKLPSIEREAFADWQLGRPVDLVAVKSALKSDGNEVASILDWMGQFETEFAEIDAAANRPFAQIPVNMGSNFIENVSTVLPFLTEFREFQKLQTIRPCPALEAGDTAQAKTALANSLQLYRVGSSHPTLIGFLVGNASLNESLAIIWQGMQSETWTAEDLEWIQTQLSELEVLDRLERSLVFEMVTMQIGGADFLKSASKGENGHSDALESMGGESGIPNALGIFAPSGIWDHNKAIGCRLMLESAILPVREHRVPDSDFLEEELKNRSLHNVLVSLTLPAVSAVIQRGLESTTGIASAQVACAIERYKLANGDYPESLAVLTPDFIDKIPDDIFAPGKPLNYKLGAEGDRYRIYSIGQNGVDDAGVVIFKNKGKRRDLEQGDWAWGYSFSTKETK